MSRRSDENVLLSVLLWPFRQVVGWFKNAYAVVTDYSAIDFFPPAIAEGWDWLKEQVPQALGFGTPGEQMSSSVVLAIASIFTGLFTGGVTIAFVLLFTLTFVGGALRLWPVINRLWPFGEPEVR